MVNEPRAMREIHKIRIENYEIESNLTSIEVARKRKADTLRVERAIAKYGLKVK